MRSLSQSKLSRPPASTHAPAPWRSSSSSAASTEVGCSSSNAGMTSLITAIVVPLGRLKPAPTGEGSGLSSSTGPSRRGLRCGAGASRPASHVRLQRFVHPAPVLERHQDDVRRHRRAPEHVDADGIRDRVHHRAVAGADRRLADAAGADRRLRIGDVERRRLEPRRDVEDRQRLGVVEAPRRATGRTAGRKSGSGTARARCPGSCRR